jgi:hypothetical protein
MPPARPGRACLAGLPRLRRRRDAAPRNRREGPSQVAGGRVAERPGTERGSRRIGVAGAVRGHPRRDGDHGAPRPGDAPPGASGCHGHAGSDTARPPRRSARSPPSQAAGAPRATGPRPGRGARDRAAPASPTAPACATALRPAATERHGAASGASDSRIGTTTVSDSRAGGCLHAWQAGGTLRAPHRDRSGNRTVRERRPVSGCPGPYGNGPREAGDAAPLPTGFDRTAPVRRIIGASHARGPAPSARRPGVCR